MGRKRGAEPANKDDLTALDFEYALTATELALKELREPLAEDLPARFRNETRIQALATALVHTAKEYATFLDNNLTPGSQRKDALQNAAGKLNALAFDIDLSNERNRGAVETLLEDFRKQLLHFIPPIFIGGSQ